MSSLGFESFSSFLVFPLIFFLFPFLFFCLLFFPFLFLLFPFLFRPLFLRLLPLFLLLALLFCFLLLRRFFGDRDSLLTRRWMSSPNSVKSLVMFPSPRSAATCLELSGLSSPFPGPFSKMKRKDRNDKVYSSLLLMYLERHRKRSKGKRSTRISFFGILKKIIWHVDVSQCQTTRLSSPREVTEQLMCGDDDVRSLRDYMISSASGLGQFVISDFWD